MAPDMLESQ